MWSQLETLCGSVERMISWNSPSCSASSMASMGSCRYETEPLGRAAGRVLDHRERELEHALSVGLAVLSLGLGQRGVFREVGNQEMEGGGAAQRALADRLDERRRRGRLVGDDEHVGVRRLQTGSAISVASLRVRLR